MDKGIYKELSSFFLIDEWENMAEYEKIRYFNLLENYRMMHSLGFNPKRPDFMCKPKRKLDEQRQTVQNKRPRFKPPIKRQDETRPKCSNIWQHIPTPFQLAHDADEDIMGFSKSDYIGQIVGLKTIKEAIKKLESELKSFKKTKEKKAETPKGEDNATGRRYPRRSVARKDYAEGDIPDDDDYIFCDDCNDEWEGDCPVHGPLTIVEDRKVPVDPKDPTRADRTLPPQLCIAQSGILGADYGVWTREPLPKGLRFGPYQGAKVESSNSDGYCWQIRRNHKPIYCVDAKDCSLANWMRYVNCARHEEEQNLMAFQYKGEVYYRTFRNVPAHTELLVWYGDEYGTELGIDLENFHKPQQIENYGRFKCAECDITFTSPVYLEKHRKYCRKRKATTTRTTQNAAEVPVPEPTPQYTCQRCSYKCASSSDVVKHTRTHEGDKCAEETHRPSGQNEFLTVVKAYKLDYGQNQYASDDCDFASDQKSQLFNQLSTFTCEEQFTFSDCDKKCAPNIDVMHRRINSDAKPFACEYCDYRCSQRTNLINHRRRHTGEKPHACEQCNCKFRRKTDRNKHSRTHACEYCDYTSAKKSDLIRHSRTHTGEKPFKCEKCDYKCAQTSHLIQHRTTHTGEKPFACEECDYKCARKSHLIQHHRTHTGEKPFACEECDYKCAETFNLIRHRRTHTGEKPFKCEKCDYKCAQTSHLIQHRTTHTGEKPFACEECDYKCARKSHLIQHHRTHTGEKPFACEECDYKCAETFNLIRHRRTHTGEKPFKCEKCDYKCAQTSHLILHRTTHTGEKPFACEECDYKCARKSHLIQHHRTHTGEKPFACEECDYKCAETFNLIRHRRTHTGEKPFKCEYCDYKCARKSNLIRHHRTHIGAKKFVCEE